MTVLSRLNNLPPGYFTDILGVEFTEWSDGLVRGRLDLKRHLLNPLDIVHGGVLCAVLDMGCGICGLYCPVPGRVRMSVTVSLTTNFVGQAGGGSLWLEGRQISGSGSLYTSNSTLCDESGKLVAHATGTFKWIKGSQVPEGVPAEEGWGS